MCEENEKLFSEFTRAHGQYALDKARGQEEFNRVGIKAVEVIREWEKKLCGHMERGDKAVYSRNLAEKFWGEVKAFWPLIDFVGVEVVKKAKVSKVAQVVKVEQVEQEKAKLEDKDQREIEEFATEVVEEFEIKRIRFS